MLLEGIGGVIGVVAFVRGLIGEEQLTDASDAECFFVFRR